MIQVDQLMKGNLVGYYRGKETVYVQEVKEIKNNMVILNDGYEIECELLEPVKVSKGILIESGFEETDTYSNPNTKMYRRGKMEVFFNSTTAECSWGFYNFDKSLKFIINVSYVHRLQQLYLALIGRRLIINIP